MRAKNGFCPLPPFHFWQGSDSTETPSGETLHRIINAYKTKINNAVEISLNAEVQTGSTVFVQIT